MHRLSARTWLAHTLAQPLPDREPGGGARRAQPGPCRFCGQPILVGLDDDTCASTRRVDPAPLDANAEAVALLAGRRTCALVLSGGAAQLQLREPEQIQRTPADPESDRPILAEHECGMPLGVGLSPIVVAEYDDTPPF